MLPASMRCSIPMAIIIEVLLFSGDHGDRNMQKWKLGGRGVVIQSIISVTAACCFQARDIDGVSCKILMWVKQECAHCHATEL
jgi:hypothetical protein